jgi:hypothetical protein
VDDSGSSRSGKQRLKKLVDYEDFLERYRTANRYLGDWAMMSAIRDLNRGFEFDMESSIFTDALQINFHEGPITAYDFRALSSDADFKDAVEQMWFVQNASVLWRRRIMNRVEEIQEYLSHW